MELSDHEIGLRAYALWEQRGMPPGTELDDWLTAQLESSHGGSLASRFAEGSVPENRHVLRAILDHATAVISVKDTRGRYAVVNERFEAVYQVTNDRIRDQTDYDLFPVDRADALRLNDLRVYASGRPVEFEQVIPQADGERTYVTLKVPVAHPGGHPYAVCGISTDVTELKRVQRSLVVQHTVTRALAESATLPDAGPRILRAVCESVGWDVGLLWLVDAAAGRLRCAEVWHQAGVSVPAFERMSRGLVLPPAVGLAGRVWATSQPVWEANIAVADGYPRAAVALEDGLHGACGFPVRNGGDVLGVLEFFSRQVRRPDPELLQLMAGITSQVSQFIERRHAEGCLHERAREFGLARTIQLGLHPKAPPSVVGFRVSGASHPAQETGGDYFDFIPLPDGSLGIAIGDASGHGIGAALVMAETRAYLRARAASDTDVGRILALVNRQLAADLPADHFVTLLFARLDARTRTLTYSSAGHWPGYVLGGRGEVRAVLGSTQFPLGIDPAAEFPVAPPVALESGDLVLLMTDGVADALSPDGRPFGAERALDVVRSCRGAGPDEIVAALLQAVRQFSAVPQTDDTTAIVVMAD